MHGYAFQSSISIPQTSRVSRYCSTERLSSYSLVRLRWRENNLGIACARVETPPKLIIRMEQGPNLRPIDCVIHPNPRLPSATRHRRRKRHCFTALGYSFVDRNFGRRLMLRYRIQLACSALAGVEGTPGRVSRNPASVTTCRV